MIAVKIEVNGKPVDPEDMETALHMATIQSVREATDSTIGDLRCPVHGQAPMLLCHGDRLDTLEMQVTGCCQQLIDMASEKLQEDDGQEDSPVE